MTEPRLSIFPLMCLFIKGSFKAKWIYEMMKGELKALQLPEGFQSVIRLVHQWKAFAKLQWVRPCLLVSILSQLSKKNVIHMGAFSELPTTF